MKYILSSHTERYDDVKKLSGRDQKLLNRLNIPQNLKVLLENYWLENPPVVSKKWSIFSVISFIFGPVIIVLLTSPYFMNGTMPLVNVLLVVLWIFYPSLAIMYFGITISLYEPAENQEDKLMARPFAMLLPGAIPYFNRVYATTVWMVTAGLVASHGYFATSLMIILCSINRWLFHKASGVTLIEFLENRARETPVQRKIRITIG